MSSKFIITTLVVALVAWRIYVRMNRTFGRQRIKPRRMLIRIILLALVGVLLLIAASRDLWTLGTMLGGAACGALIALIGLRYTQFETTAEGRFYTPHTYTGLAVTVLFLGRLAYDFTRLEHGLPGPSANGAAPSPLAEYNPLTLAVSGLFIAYYLGYYLAVLRRSRQSTEPSPAIPADPE